jgi:hypothetical protein
VKLEIFFNLYYDLILFLLHNLTTCHYLILAQFVIFYQYHILSYYLFFYQFCSTFYFINTDSLFKYLFALLAPPQQPLGVYTDTTSITILVSGTGIMAIQKGGWGGCAIIPHLLPISRRVL